MNNYSLIEIINENLVGLYHPKHGRQAWCEVFLRKPATCVVTGVSLKPKEIAFRPVTNGYNRMERISKKGINVLASKMHVHRDISKTIKVEAKNLRKRKN